MNLLQIISRRRREYAEKAGERRAEASPHGMFRSRLVSDKKARVSLIVIGLFAIVAILGYLITPDGTPWCNQQYPELATQKPFSRATMAYIDEGKSTAKPRLLHKMLYGEPLRERVIPIYSYQEEGDSIRLESYTGVEPNDGEEYRFPKEQVSIKRRVFILGTDSFGRDVLSQVMIGSRVSLSVGMIAVGIALVIGIFFGMLSGYYGGWVDRVIMWFINVVWSIPTVLLVVAITFALGKGFWQVFVAVGLTMWVEIARVVRGQVMGVRELEYIEATRALGYRTGRIMMRHILPNIMGPVIVIAASNFATAILLESGLSFLGIGVQPPMPSWGTMVKENYGQILLDSAYLAFIPGIAIMIIVLSFILLGDSIRDALNIREGQ